MSQKEEGEVEIHGDVLETILTHVPLIHLVSASAVSKWWCAAVSSSLRHHNPPKPWLILHTQSTRFPYAATTRAYDPRSNIWINISPPSTQCTAAIRSSPSNFLYTLSPSEFSFSPDPLGHGWCTVDPPRVWRTDPIVARVGDYVVMGGGVCDFEDDPLAVEIYDFKTRAWCTCESIPASLKDSATSSWLSIAATSEKLVVTDKHSGLTHWFNTVTKSWSEQFVLNPVEHVNSYHIGSSNYGLLLVGVCGINENLERVIKIWRIIEDDFLLEEIGEMPREFVTKLMSKSLGISSSIDIRVAGGIVYIYNTWEAEVVVACELLAGGGCWWWSVSNVVARGGMVAARLVFSSSEISIEELQRAMVVNKWRFEVSPVS